MVGRDKERVMAEYIDRNKTQAYLYNNMMWYDGDGYMAEDSEKDKALWDLVNGIPTADVIERSKIDKAIEEIEQLINHSKLPTVNIYNRYSDGLKDCLEIIKRNIGE